MYTYTQRDLLAEPEYYMYSAFEGVSFLRDYRAQRADVMAQLKNHPCRLPAEDREPTTRNPGERLLLVAEGGKAQSAGLGEWKEFLASREESERIVTQEVLSALEIAFTEDTGDEDQVLTWLGKLVQRFEVNKRLYRVYTRRMRRDTEETEPVLSYAVLSAMLLLHYEKSHNLKMLNGALKLNDLLCSVRERLEEDVEVRLVLANLRKEMDLVEQLAVAKGVAW